MTRRLSFISLICAVMAALVAIGPASGIQVSHDRVVSAVPASGTPAINNGKINTIAQVGNTMIVGGTFTSVTSPGSGTALTRNYIVAFDANTGAVSGSFNPQFNGVVNEVTAGPNGTVYVGGSFSQMNGSSVPRVVQLNVANGARVGAFNASSLNGAVLTMALRGNRLFVGGNFTAVGGAANRGLTTLNATTGVRDPFMNIEVTERHNNSGSGAQGAIGVRALDVTPDGSRMVIIGNFRKVNGLDRVQIAMIDLGATATVDASWNTDRYVPLCFNFAFDTYMRGVQMSPDGSYFVVGVTGGPVGGTLCDTAARWETHASGTNVQPTWSSYSGGDTLWAVSVTDTAVYVGGHQRWMNNPDAGDYAGPGAVPRPGIVALDPVNGVPLDWNPGRNPRGAGAEALLATPTGLWVGSDTEWIGDRDYRRPRIARFPLAGGSVPPAPNTGALPGQVFLPGGSASGGGTAGNVLYRVNAGGSSLSSLDAGPDWTDDTAGTSPNRNSGSNAAGWNPVPAVDGTVPASTPAAIFDSERWDPSGLPEMQWDFPVTAGVPLQVRLYLSNRCDCTENAGQRVFDVSIDGDPKLSSYDLIPDVGDDRGTMKAYNITSDGTVDIDFGHVVENPLVNGIEIVRTDMAPPPPLDNNVLTYRNFDGTTAGADQAADGGGIPWSQARGAFMVGSTLYYGWTDNRLYKRSFDGTDFGPATMIDPYHDPYWANVDTGSGNTYNGAFPSFYNEMSNVTGMFFKDGRLYYTLFGQSALFYRGFTPDSGIVGQTRFQASGGMNWSDTRGMFVNGDHLYFGSQATGNLRRVSLVNGTPSAGTVTTVSGPGTDGRSWKSRAAFLLTGTVAPPPPNVAPVARFTASCTELSCSFDATASSDSDGTIASYAWTFGDTATGTGQSPNHAYAAEGTYEVTLTVTDNDGATHSVSHDVVASSAPASDVAFVGASHANGNSATVSAPVPDGVAAGDTLLMFLSTGNAVTPAGPTGVAGWTQLDSHTNATMTTTVWWKSAGAGDAGGQTSFDLGGSTKSNLVIAAYSGTNGTNPVSGVAKVGDSGTATHTTPVLSVTGGSYVVSFWSDKSSSTEDWTAPSGVTVRDESLGTGGGRYTSLLADSGAPVPAGDYGGLDAVTNAASGKAIMYTLALAPGAGG